ncbi:MAG: hypothetical protein IJA34_04770 [Lachnospiraceae bacterium]|nr:hypothetical protein [Lachnospiraceae bacterium]
MNNNTETILNEFDKRIKQLNSYSIIMSNLLKYISLIIGCFLIIIPATEIDLTIFLVNSFLLEMGLHSHIYCFLYTPEDGIMKPIYKVLSNTPIDKKVYFKIRFKQYLKYCSKVFLICTFIQALGFFMNKDYSFDAVLLSILYIIVLFALSVIEGICTIKLSISSNK